MEKVKNVLDIDSKYRYKGVTDDLYIVGKDFPDQNIESKEWDYSLPTFTKYKNPFNKSKIKNINIEKFSLKFRDDFKSLETLDMSGILIAGGCISNSISNNSLCNSDVDIFIYGISMDQVQAKILDIYNTIKRNKQNKENERAIKNKVTPHDIEVPILTTSKYTLIDNNFQIIHRLYKSISEILHGFDIGSSAVGFDGVNLYFTTLSKFAFEYGCNILDTSRRSTSYEFRLQKYFDRGFEIILPELDISKISNPYYDEYGITLPLCMPFFIVSFRETFGNKIIIDKFHKKSKQVSDYDSIKMVDYPEFTYFYKNLEHLVTEKYSRLVDYISDIPVKSKTSSHNLYNISKSGVDWLYKKIMKKIMDSDKFPVKMCNKYLIGDIETIFKSRNDKSKLMTIIENTKNEIYKRITVNSNLSISSWITVNPGTQLTGSFNPIIEEPQKWYGEFYRKL